MDFARKQMEKYGWKEGQGLGKDETGITDALKPKVKNNNNGLGFDISEEFTNNWWDTLYKKASDNISVTETSGSVKLSQVAPDSVQITNSEYQINKKGKKGVEQSFVKTSKIIEGSTIDFGIVIPEQCTVKIPVISDEELFKACGGRTAHKGARHGLNLSGKLARIEKQEKMLLKQMRRISLNEEEVDSKIEKKCKKMEKLKTSDKLDKKDDEKISKKKKKKKRKSVSFSNAIVEVIPENEADSSFNSEDRLGYESSSTGDAPHPPSPYPQFSRSRSSSPISSRSSTSPKPKPFSRSPSPYPAPLFCAPAHIENNNNNNNSNLADEGIEQDFPDTSKSSVQVLNDKSRVSEVNDHKSFEERSDRFRAGLQMGGFKDNKGDALLSKAEKKLKFRKMRATERFLSSETSPIDINPSYAVACKSSDFRSYKSVQLNLKRKKGKQDDTEDSETDNKRDKCKGCFKKSKKDRKQEKVVNRIAKGLEKVCRINDGDEDDDSTKKKNA